MSADLAKLATQGRAKDASTPWSNEELEAIASGVDREDIRSGKWKPAKSKAPAPKKAEGGDAGDTNTPDDKDPKDPKPFDLAAFLANPKTKADELKAKAAELNVEIAPDATKAEIVEAITKATTNTQ